MHASVIVLTIAAFLVRCHADYTSCTNTRSLIYAEHCYQVFYSSTGTQVEYHYAKAQCSAEGGSLAIVIGNYLSDKLAELFPPIVSSAFVALEQDTATSPNLYGPGDNWFWRIGGVLNKAAPDGSDLIPWAADNPSDFNLLLLRHDQGKKQYGALQKMSIGIADVDAAAGYICQFRKYEAVLHLYAENKKLTVQDRQSGDTMIAATAGACAVECYSNPMCMAVNYNPYSAAGCQMMFDRPQDNPNAMLTDETVVTKPFVALEQDPPSDTSNMEVGDNWFWRIEGNLNQRVAAGSGWIVWASGYPNDLDHDSLDGGIKQYGALEKGAAVGMVDVETVIGYICQFRKYEAVLHLYAENKKLVVEGRQSGDKMNAATVRSCVVVCYSNAACMAFNYNPKFAVCHMMFDRPQDNPDATLTDEVGGQVWVKE